MKPAPLHWDLRNPHYISWLHFLKETEGWSITQIQEYQIQEIQRIVHYAYQNTRKYRELYDQWNICPEDLKDLKDFQKLPFVEKEMIRDDLEGFSVKIPGRIYVTTGGSTGIPLGFYRDRISFARELASKAHQYYRVGWKEGDRQMVLRGIPINTPSHIRYDPRFNELRCSSYFLTPESMDGYIAKAREFQPQWIRCYPSSGFLLARYLKETGKSFPPVKGILCASENLYDFQKSLMRNVFGARVFSHYGHYEMAVLAGFCEYEDTYHVLPQYGFAELIDQNGAQVTRPGEIGEIVATSFIMQATPFIRYKTRDLAVLKSWGCPSCGRPYQVWERIEGRSHEFILTGKGRLISMTAINMHDDIFDSIKQFQFFQERRGEVIFRFIPKDHFQDRDREKIKAGLLHKLGDDVQLTLESTEEIHPTARGKRSFLVQKLNLGIPASPSLTPRSGQM